MARTKEDAIKEILGALTFQNACLVADLEAANEQIAALKAEGEKAKESKPQLVPAVAH